MEIGDDERLMMEFVAGNGDAFAQLVKRHQRPLLNFYYRLFWDHHKAEDCVQEVFRRIVAAKMRYKPMSKFTTFMYTIAKNYWIDQCRRRAAALGNFYSWRQETDWTGCYRMGAEDG